jgi:SAM-dependent methyltransferase
MPESDTVLDPRPNGPVSRPTYPSGLRLATARGSVPPTSHLPPPGTQATPDFSEIDFERLWAGRDKVTRVEGEILLRALAGEPPGRGLEIGAGGGRLTPYLARWSRDLVACDATLPLLRRSSSAQRPPAEPVGANVYHLPFEDETFAVATLVRVLGFLTDPIAALREIHRVLRTGGLLVVSFEPHPTASSLLDDLKVSFARRRGEAVRTMTFSRASVVPVRPSAYPAWSYSRGHLTGILERVGFLLEAEYPCGLEDLFGFRQLPTSVFLSLSPALSRMGGFPTRFLRVRKVPARGDPTRERGPPD